MSLRRLRQSLTHRSRTALRTILRPKQVVHRGVTLDVSSDVISESIRTSIYSGGYESKECDLLAKTLEPHDRVLELGSGIGFLGAFCSLSLGDGAKVCCVEANPSLAPLVHQTFSLNGVEPIFLSAAIAEKDGDLELHTTKNFWSSSTVRGRESDFSVKVSAIALHRVLENFRPSYVVADIEGAECEVLRQSLPGVEKLCVEIHPHVTGDRPINHLVASLFSQGFLVDYRKSTNAVLYLTRTSHNRL